VDVTSTSSPAGPGGAAGAAAITLDRIGKRYPDGTQAVAELSLEIPAGELVVLIGPSGCGKSTLLRMINRLIEPTSGRILLGTEDVTRTDPVQLRRRIGYVIQNVGLFPHQTIRANIGTVPRLLGWSRARIRKRAEELLELVGLDPATFGRRYPHELSGGQRQRVGVARALAADPVVLLMDEPFSAVDPIARSRLQEEFLRLQAEVRKTIVLVTHDLDEAVRLGDRIAVLSQGGRLEQYAAPATLLGEPASPFVREFVGADRAIRRLAVTPITPRLLRPFPAGEQGNGLPSVPADASLYDALAVLLRTNADDARVVGAGGEPIGLLSRHRILSLDYPADPAD
jgi:osmoprotectant transport system ATP-binding protein